MLYYSRQFKRHMQSKQNARMTAIPQLDVPEILVDNEEERRERNTVAGVPGGAGIGTLTEEGATLLAAAAADTNGRARSWSGLGADLSSYDTSYGHPLAGSRTSKPSSSGHQAQRSGFSFDLPDPADGAQDDEATSPIGRRGSSVSPAVVRDMLDDSVWVESIRRSATMRKSGWGPSGGF